MNGKLKTTKLVCKLNIFIQYRDRLRNPFEMRVVMGTLNRFQKNSQTQIQNIRTIIPHPKYRQESFENDIGLVIVMMAVKRVRVEV